MIINESNRANDYEEIEIKDPKKFISAIGGIMDSGMKESCDFVLNEYSDEEEKEMLKNRVKDILKRNKMSAPPTVQEIKRNDNKIQVPWFLVGTLLSKAKNYGLEKKFKEKNK